MHRLCLSAGRKARARRRLSTRTVLPPPVYARLLCLSCPIVCRPIAVAIVAAAAAAATGRRVTRHVPFVVRHSWRRGAVSRARAHRYRTARATVERNAAVHANARARPVVVVIRTTAAYGLRRTRPIQFFLPLVRATPPTTCGSRFLFYNNTVTMSFPPYPIYMFRRLKRFQFTLCNAIVVGHSCRIYFYSTICMRI